MIFIKASRQLKALQVAHTISPGNYSLAIKGPLKLALIPVSCRAECMDTESGPAPGPKETSGTYHRLSYECLCHS